MKKLMEDRARPSDTEPDRSAQQYEAPKITRLGNMSELTLGVGGSNPDMGQRNFTKRGAG